MKYWTQSVGALEYNSIGYDKEYFDKIKILREWCISLLVVDSTGNLPGQDVVCFGRCGRTVGECQAYRVCRTVPKLGIHWAEEGKSLGNIKQKVLKTMKK